MRTEPAAASRSTLCAHSIRWDTCAFGCAARLFPIVNCVAYSVFIRACHTTLEMRRRPLLQEQERVSVSLRCVAFRPAAREWPRCSRRAASFSCTRAARLRLQSASRSCSLSRSCLSTLSRRRSRSASTRLRSSLPESHVLRLVCSSSAAPVHSNQPCSVHVHMYTYFIPSFHLALSSSNLML